jgi:5-methylcytosine-specific restriction endonuclease McrBC regulatory subunit McrC
MTAAMSNLECLSMNRDHPRLLGALLDSLTRRLESTTDLRTAPRGRVDWSDYAQKQIPRGQFVALPCTYPDLRDDRILKGAISFALEKQLRVLQTQVEHGAFVHRLLELCEHLLMKVRGVAPMLPPLGTFQQWMQRPMRSTQFLDGLQAIEWTAEERGLAGLSDLEGIPWTLPMNDFFEAFAETVLQMVARRLGAQLKVGRRRETTHPINWCPTFVGLQRSLFPDLWLEWQGTTLIVDAKYKRHW